MCTSKITPHGLMSMKIDKVSSSIENGWNAIIFHAWNISNTMRHQAGSIKVSTQNIGPLHGYRKMGEL